MQYMETIGGLMYYVLSPVHPLAGRMSFEWLRMHSYYFFTDKFSA
jgi:hypothetical protein